MARLNLLPHSYVAPNHSLPVLTKLTIGTPRVERRRTASGGLDFNTYPPWILSSDYSTATLEVSSTAFDLSGVDIQGLAGHALAGFLYRCS